MDRRKQDNEGRLGRMPAMAPLATPYVPFQLEDPPKYEPRMALVRGTLFPGLDLPFMGMVNEDLKPDTLLSQLQTVNFAVQELALYLDTHQEDLEAFEVYQSYQKLYTHCREEYLKTSGPLNHMQITDEKRYAWLDDPWPWEYSKNKEV